MAKKKTYDTSIINKLAYLVHEEKISRKELAKVLGYKHPDYITHLIRGIRRLPEKKYSLLNQFFEQATEKVVITGHEIIEGELDYDLIRKFINEAKKVPVERLKEMVKDTISDIEKESDTERGKKRGTPGLYYFKVFTTQEPKKKIESFYKGRDEKIIGIYNMTPKGIQELLASLYITLQEGLNQSQYADKAMSIIRQLEARGLI